MMTNINALPQPGAFSICPEMHQMGQVFAQTNNLASVLAVSGVALRMQDGMVLVGQLNDEIVCDATDLRGLASFLVGVAGAIEQEALAEAAAITATHLRDGQLVVGLGEALLGRAHA